MAADYGNIGNIFANIEEGRAGAINSFSNALEILQDLEKKTGYHHSLIDDIKGYILELQKRNRRVAK
jgi:hypothetical protein